VLPALRAGALYDSRAPLPAALERPLLARTLLEIAAIEHADAVAHGGGGRRRRASLDLLLHALDPGMKIEAPARDWNLSREERLAFARSRDLPVPPSSSMPFRSESNLWGRSIEAAVTEDGVSEPREDMFTLTRPAPACPDEAAYVELTFDRTGPSAINGVTLPLLDLIASLTTLASAHGVGRVDAVERRVGRDVVREIDEAPAAVLLHAAQQELRKIPGARDFERFYRTVSAEYADIIESGRWFSPLRDSLDAFVARAQEKMAGTVRLKLFKGSYSIVGRTAAETNAAGSPLIQIAKSR
jgi:argininosuccinate synthase